MNRDVKACEFPICNFFLYSKQRCIKKIALRMTCLEMFLFFRFFSFDFQMGCEWVSEWVEARTGSENREKVHLCMHNKRKMLNINFLNRWLAM